MYRETKNPVYLNHAKKVAAFIMNHPRMPADKVPYWDFDAPDIPLAPRGAAAAAVIASALAELRQFVDRDTARHYSDFAGQQIRSLTSPLITRRSVRTADSYYCTAPGISPKARKSMSP